MLPSELALKRILTFVAFVCLATSVAILAIPFFYADGRMRLTSSSLEERMHIKRGGWRSGVISIERKEEIAYQVGIWDQHGSIVTHVLSDRLPTPIEGEVVHYLPLWPRLYVPHSDYSYSIHLLLAAIIFPVGLVSIFGASRVGQRKVRQEKL